MKDPRIAIALAMVACTAAACRQSPSNQAAPNAAAANVSVSRVAAPTPTPTVTPSPSSTPSPRSIMQPSVAPEPVQPPPLLPIDGTVNFPNGGAALDDAAKATLDKLAADPATATGGPVILRGSTDSSGNDADNLAMSRRRARAVAAYLESKGVAKDRIQVIALGEGRPVAPDRNLDGSDNPAGRAKNRRVDIEIDLPAPAPPAEAAAAAAPANTTAAAPQ